MTAASLVLRFVGLFFQIYLSGQIGAAGVGQLQLILSVYFLATAFAVSGIRLAVTRLVAEELSTGKDAGAKRAVKIGLAYSLAVSSACAAALLGGADFIGGNWLASVDTIPALRILALSLPFSAANAVLAGYFTAVLKISKLSVSLLAEQILRVGSTVICLQALLPRGLSWAFAAIAVGSCVGEIACFTLLLLQYCYDARRYQRPTSSPGLLPRMLKITAPVAAGACVTSTIRTLQQTLIPYSLRQGGASGEQALAAFGSIQGMALPLLLFPAIVFHGVTELIIPELAECLALGQQKRLCYIINRVFHLGALISFGLTGIFFRFAEELGCVFYNNADVGFYLRVLAPLLPILYLDLITDGMLKGIGQQVHSMGYNILESTLGATLIYLLLPRFGIAGYIFTLFITRGLNLSLSLNRLRKHVPLNNWVPLLIKAAFAAFNALVLSNLISKAFNFAWLPGQIFIVAACYCLLLRLLICITDEHIIWFKALFK